jgi:formylglycine-generating enzyme required for sulfatase activity
VLKPSLIFEPEMVLIPAGEFLMGSDPLKDELAFDDEQPQHRLYLDDYYLSRTPVTNAQYAIFIARTEQAAPGDWTRRKPPPGKDDYPVTGVSWNDVVAYSRWLTTVSGKPYGLPSEAQWEKGARGTDGRIWPWGNEWDPQRCNSLEGGPGETTPVAAYPEGASPYGLLDMAGNVWEWTRSLHKPYPYQADDGRENLKLEGFLVLRGGSHFHGYPRRVRCASRLGFVPYLLYGDYGFRVVLTPRRSKE